MHSPAEILRSVLVTLGLGTDPSSNGNWPIYVRNEPNKPDNCITIYDTLGTDDGRSMIDGEVWHHEGLQIRVRSADYPTGWEKARTIKVAIAQSINFTATTVDSSHYTIYCCAKIGDILPIGNEQTSKRELFTINCVVALDR